MTTRSISVPLAGAMAIAVTAFAFALIYSQSRLGTIDRRALAIATNAAPSVEHLAEGRAQLFRLAANVREFASEGATRSQWARGQMLESRNLLIAEIAAYQSLSSFPGEGAMAADLTRRLGDLDDALRRLLDGEVEGAELRDLQAAIQSFAAVVQRLIDFNAAQLQEETHQILEARRRAVMTAVVLGGIAVACACLATLLGARALRQRVRLMAEHRKLVEARASELEAFSGRVAHDLKGPLNTIGLLAFSGVRQSPAEGNARNPLDRIAHQVTRMNEMIDALLDFARAGARPEAGARADLGRVVEHVLDEIRPTAQAAGVELRGVRLDEARVACSAGAASVVLSNLVRNAIKYIDGGPGRLVEVRLVRRAVDALVEVEDTGHGVPPGAQESIFEPYVRLERRGVPGLGLGLATVKRLVEGYGGAVGVRSVEGRGSCFWFSLPLSRDDEAVARSA
jgi:signal transduction histidine kinase